MEAKISRLNFWDIKQTILKKKKGGGSFYVFWVTLEENGLCSRHCLFWLTSLFRAVLFTQVPWDAPDSRVWMCEITATWMQTSWAGLQGAPPLPFSSTPASCLWLVLWFQVQGAKDQYVAQSPCLKVWLLFGPWARLAALLWVVWLSLSFMKMQLQRFISNIVLLQEVLVKGNLFCVWAMVHWKLLVIP